MAVICEDIMKERVSGHVRLSTSLPLTNSSFTSSSTSSSSLRSLSEGSLHAVGLGESPKTTTIGEPLRNKQPENDSNDNTEVGVGDRGNKASSDEDWELLFEG